MHVCSHVHTHIYTYSGGTVYTIKGNRLSTPQIRHLVFYTIPRPEIEDAVTPSKRQVNSPPYSTNFTVPTPSLSGGPVTECAETWDIISEVYSIHT